MIYSIHSFDDGPHWDAAYIEADSEEIARSIMRRVVEASTTHRHDYPAHPDAVDELHDPLPEEEWKVRQLTEPLRFVLGSWCR